MTCKVAVDIGGTFTDFCVFDETSGKLSTFKTLSTPATPGAEVSNGLKALEQRHGLPPTAISYFTHGTTVGVNTVIQRRGAALALFTTRGFEDVLEVARLKVPDPYNIFSARPAPLAPRERVFGINERTLKDGNIEQAIDEEDVLSAITKARALGSDTIVVALLHAYANPENERKVRALIQRSAPDLTVTLSSDVWPVIREYERTVTATVAGYVQRRVADYIGSLQATLAQCGIGAELMITKSNGGIMAAELGKTDPVAMLLSGTASGVIGAAHIAANINAPNVLSFDVGGTSADVAVIRQGKPAFGTGELVGDFPIYVPTVSVSSIGEGGGSIAWIDDFGVLKVGPESAGSTPGPACYGMGGERATITDAFAVLGLLGSGELGYGSVTLDREASKNAINQLAQPLGLTLEATAESIIRVAISGMYLEISKLISRHGVDPREFDLLAFGGAGPMTACLLARELGIARVIVPPTPGVLSAYGGLIADIRNDFISTVFVDLDNEGIATLERRAVELEQRARHWLRNEQQFAGEAQLVFTADMRYRGQSYEIETPVNRNDITNGALKSLAEQFHAEHARVYAHADKEAPIQVVNLRLVVSGTVTKPEVAQQPPQQAAPEPVGKTTIFLDGAEHQARLYGRDRLSNGHYFNGPAIVTQNDCTSIIPPRFAVQVDGWGNLLISQRVEV